MKNVKVIRFGLASVLLSLLVVSTLIVSCKKDDPKPIVKFTVTFNANGENVTGLPDNVVVVEGKSLSKPSPDPARSGNIFDGWYKEQTCTNAFIFGTDIVSADITLYAKWTGVTYVVTFSANVTDPTRVSKMPSAVGAEYNGLIQKPASDPVHADPFAFDGWYKEAGCVNAFNFNVDVITSDITLYAKWNAVPQSKVTFVMDYFYKFADQPIIDIKCDFVVEPVMGNQGSPLSSQLIPGNLTATAGDLQTYGKGLPFVFGGWTTDVMGIEDFDIVKTPIPDHDITLYAKWVMAPQFFIFRNDTISAEATGGGCWRDVAHVVVPSKIGEQAIHVIESGAFWYMRNGPNTVVISEGITTLMGAAFQDSPGLIKITLPSTLTYIGKMCFVIGGSEFSAFGPPRLREIIINATTPPVVGETWFWLETRDPGLVVKVPKGTLSVYQSAPGWEPLYGNMIEQE